ncbi:MAG: hypothetical protein ACI9SJ_001897 [Flavobacteriaceae bacterium]|jgi:hypothetical protein
MKQKLLIITTVVVFLSTVSMLGQSFTVAEGTYLVMSGEVTVDYSGGDFTNNGTINDTEGTLEFSGPVNYAAAGTTNINDLTVDNFGTTLLNSKFNMMGTLRVVNGTLDTRDNLTLVANEAGSSFVAPVGEGAAIRGKVTVERYIGAGKSAFRFLAPCVTTEDFISNNWQLNTHITGSTTGANGFDASASGNPSLYTHNNAQASGTGWAPIANTNATNLNAMQGYRIFILGDRDADITAAPLPEMNNPVTLSATGTLTIGRVVFDSSSEPSLNSTTNAVTDGYSLVGNPYVNSVDWHTLVKENLTDTYYAWDANMGTVEQRGRYVAYSIATESSTMASVVNQYIQPGQSFWIKNISDSSGSLTFEETDKRGKEIIPNFYKTTASGLSRLELQVYQTSELTIDSYPIDAATSVFDNQFTNAIENGDITKLSTGVENLSFLNSDLALAIDARPQVTASDELLVQLQQFKANKDYTFRTHFSNFDTAATPFLLDTYLDKYTALSNDMPTDVRFITTSEVASYDLNRFKIVFQKNGTLGLENLNAEQILVYPNPVTNNQFNIALPSYLIGEVAIKLTNAIGQTVYQTKIEAQNTVSITPKNTLLQGLYLVQITNQGRRITKKILIK